MTLKLTTLAVATAFALTPIAAWSQSGNGQAAADQSSGTKSKIHKQTDPQKNGTSQSESRDGMNKNGQPQK